MTLGVYHFPLFKCHFSAIGKLHVCVMICVSGMRNHRTTLKDMAKRLNKRLKDIIVKEVCIIVVRY